MICDSILSLCFRQASTLIFLGFFLSLAFKKEITEFKHSFACYSAIMWPSDLATVMRPMFYSSAISGSFLFSFCEMVKTKIPFVMLSVNGVSTAIREIDTSP